MKKKPTSRKSSPRRPFGDQPPGHVEVMPSRRFGNKPVDRLGDKSGGRFGDKPAGRLGDKSGGRLGDKPAARLGDKSGGRFGDKPAGRLGDKSGGYRGTKPVERPFVRAQPAADDYDGSPRKRYHARPFMPHAKQPFSARPSDVHPEGKPAARRVELDFDDLIYGVHAIEEALRAGEELLRLHVGIGRDRDPLVAGLLEAAERLKVSIRFEKPDFFANIPYKAHQSIIAVGQPFDYITLDEAMAIRSKERLIVVMDHLTDPHNVGAILRTAECAGAQAAILPDRRSAGVNATVRKVAAGATSHLAIAKVGNLAQTIRSLKHNGFTVIGATLGDGAKAMAEIDMTGDVALVIGAEGEGLSRLVGRSCDVLAKIPLKGKVASLNASVAAGILLYEVVRQREDELS